MHVLSAQWDEVLPMMDDKEERDKIRREMRLPEGKTCNNCDWYHRCSEVIGLENSGSTKCD